MTQRAPRMRKSLLTLNCKPLAFEPDLRRNDLAQSIAESLNEVLAGLKPKDLLMVDLKQLSGIGGSWRFVRMPDYEYEQAEDIYSRRMFFTRLS